MLDGHWCLPICNSSTQKPEMGSPWASWIALVSSGFNSGDPDSENTVKSNEDSWLSALSLHRYTRQSRHTRKYNCTDTGKYTQIPTYKKKKPWKKWKSKHGINFKLFYCILGCFIYPVMESLAGRSHIFTVTLEHMLYNENLPEMQCILECISPLAGFFLTVERAPAESLPCLFPPAAEFYLAKKCF